MKTYIKFIAAFILAGSLFGCVKQEEYQPGAAVDPNCTALYFPSENSTSLAVDPADSASVMTATFVVRRLKSDQAMNIPVKVIQQDSVFTEIPASFDFPAGVDSLTFDVVYTGLKAGKDYKLVLSAGDTYINPYSIVDGGTVLTVTASISRWDLFYEGTYISQSGYVKAYKQKIYKMTGKEKYKLTDFLGVAGQDIIFNVKSADKDGIDFISYNEYYTGHDFLMDSEGNWLTFTAVDGNSYYIDMYHSYCYFDVSAQKACFYQYQMVVSGGTSRYSGDYLYWGDADPGIPEEKPDEYKWEKVAAGTYYNKISGKSWEQTLYKTTAEEHPGLYKLTDYFATGTDLIFTINSDYSIVPQDLTAKYGKYFYTAGITVDSTKLYPVIDAASCVANLESEKLKIAMYYADADGNIVLYDETTDILDWGGWETWKTATYTSGSDGSTYSVVISKSATNENQYKVVNYDNSGHDLIFTVSGGAIAVDEQSLYYSDKSGNDYYYVLFKDYYDFLYKSSSYTNFNATSRTITLTFYKHTDTIKWESSGGGWTESGTYTSKIKSDEVTTQELTYDDELKQYSLTLPYETTIVFTVNADSTITLVSGMTYYAAYDTYYVYYNNKANYVYLYPQYSTFDPGKKTLTLCMYVSDYAYDTFTWTGGDSGGTVFPVTSTYTSLVKSGETSNQTLSYDESTKQYSLTLPYETTIVFTVNDDKTLTLVSGMTYYSAYSTYYVYYNNKADYVYFYPNYSEFDAENKKITLCMYVSAYAYDTFTW